MLKWRVVHQVVLSLFINDECLLQSTIGGCLQGKSWVVLGCLRRFQIAMLTRRVITYFGLTWYRYFMQEDQVGVFGYLCTFVALIFLKGLSSLSATKSKLNIFCADELKSEMGDRLYQKETTHGSCMDEWEGCCDPVWSSPSQVPTAHGNLEILEKSMDFAVMAFLQFWKI